MNSKHDASVNAHGRASASVSVLPAPDARPPSDAGSTTVSDAAPVDPRLGCNGAVDCARVVFVTSFSFTAYGLGGLAAADAKCNALATFADDDRVRGRSFVAWLSDGTTSPSARLVHGTGKYIRPDGETIAEDFAELTSAQTATRWRGPCGRENLREQGARVGGRGTATARKVAPRHTMPESAVTLS